MNVGPIDPNASAPVPSSQSAPSSSFSEIHNAPSGGTDSRPSFFGAYFGGDTKTTRALEDSFLMMTNSAIQKEIKKSHELRQKLKRQAEGKE